MTTSLHTTRLMALGVAVLVAPECALAQTFQIRLGHGTPVCEKLLRALSSGAPEAAPPFCALASVLIPRTAPVAWQPLPVLQHERLVFDMERRLGYELSPGTEEDFDEWRARLLRRTAVPGIGPRLRTAKVLLDPLREPMMVYAYEPGEQWCDPDRQSTWERGTGPYMFYLDDQTGTLGESWIRGHAVLHEGRLLVLSGIVTDRTHYWVWTAALDRFEVNPTASAARISALRPRSFCWLESTQMVPRPLSR